VQHSIAISSEAAAADGAAVRPHPFDTALPQTMTAVAAERYGRPDVLRLRDVPTPAADDEQVLVRVRASSVNPIEWYQVTGPYFARFGSGLRRPKSSAVGADLAGRVEAVGRNVGEFRPGDEVFGAGAGAWAEYACARADRLALKPADVAFEEAAAVPVAAITALQALRDHGQVEPGQRVLINGASGGVGTFAVQIAKSFGARVTAVCSTAKVDLVRSLGADHVVDYRQEDFTSSGDRHDVMLDVAGSRRFSHFRRVLTPDATVVLIGGPMTYRGLGPLPHLGATLLASWGRSQTVKFLMAKITKDDLAVLAELLESGQVKPVIEERYELSRAADALRHLGEGHARGKLVITV
jgi:NADPH:quinone reductase-like Zn-dependent oxidoreductase